MGLTDQQRIHVQLLAFLFCAFPLSAEVTLSIAAKSSNTFDPNIAIGAGIDGHEQGEIADKLSPANVARMRSAGLKPLIYRLRTELAGQAWHWNPQGTWSDAAHNQGYWTGSQKSLEPIQVSYGFRLPRRGNSIDQADNDGYSRIDDGDSDTFWKSNPYLGDKPQWIAVNLGRTQRINTVRILWGEPRAIKFHMEYSAERFMDLTADANWLPLLPGVTQQVRWLRVVLDKGAGSLSADWRDGAGFAIRELSAGYMDSAGHFTDAVRHGASHNKQTTIWVSSTDPWHRAVDRDANLEQPGIDLTFQSGLANGLPVILAAPVLYDTPENSAALLAYAHAKGYPVTDVELGEEPEEQFTTPEDYGALSLKVIGAIRSAGFNPRFGGPSLILLLPNLATDSEWIMRLYGFYKAAGRLDALGFFSFEWYPFDDVCGDSSKQLAESAELLSGSLRKLKDAGVPTDVPWYMTEYGFSAYGAQAEVDLPGALLNAESVALFLTNGGARAFLYGYEPGELLHDRSCSWGNNMLFMDDKPTATYWAARVISQAWAAPEGGPHYAFAVSTDNALVSAYALQRPTGEMSILIVNKSSAKAESTAAPFEGLFTVTRFSGEQYRWLAARSHSHALRSNPPVSIRQSEKPVQLPPYSLTVMTGVMRER